MVIDFFDVGCQSRTQEAAFGIIDRQPAKLDFNNSEEWQVGVDNSLLKEIVHTAIDHCCMKNHKAEGKHCESMITYDDILIFLELKDRGVRHHWVKEAKIQLINTINLFKRDSTISSYKRLYGHIANRQRPVFKAGNKILYQEFEDQTGFILRISGMIKIE